MPAQKVWFGTENDQLDPTRDSEALFADNLQDQRFRRDTDDGSAAQSSCDVATAEPSQTESLDRQSVHETHRDRHRDAEKEQVCEGVKEVPERLSNNNHHHHIASSISQDRASERTLAPKPRLAFLGPLGTYSHQAAFECFGDSVEYLARPTIAGVRQNLSAVVPFGLIPQENSTNGSVIETYDVLRTPVVGQEIFVRGVTVFEVKHSLVIRQGVKMEDIENVLSHEQALGQCRGWLTKHLPQASLVPMDSTASAAKRLLSAEGGLDPMKCAAICSSLVATIYEGLEILENSIQDGIENFTRFYILSHGLNIALPEGYPLSTGSMALLRLQSPPSDRAKPMLNIFRAVSVLDVTILRIDRRPSVHGRPFDSVYFLEVGATPGQNSPKQLWTKQVEQVADKIRCMGVDVEVLGCW